MCITLPLLKLSGEPANVVESVPPFIFDIGLEKNHWKTLKNVKVCHFMKCIVYL